MVKSILIFGGLLIAGLLLYFYFSEKQPEFPYASSGNFIQAPAQGDNMKSRIEWVIPDTCAFNEILYSDAETKEWGGITATCQLEDGNTSRCSVDTDKVLEKNQSYDIQANSRECNKKENFVSKAISIKFSQ